MKTKLTSLLLGTATILMFSACDDKDTEASSGGGTATLGTGFAGGVQLETELPAEKVEGSPAPKNIPNLMPRLKKFPKFLVPEGTVLVSKDKKVTSSDDYPILGDFPLVTDGDKEADEGCFLELIDGKQWVQIDLEESTPLYGIIVWHYHAAKRVYHDVIVQVSDDAEFKSGVTTLYNNDYDDSYGLGKGNNQPYIESRYGLLMDGKGAKARYVRLHSRGSSAGDTNQYTEVEVYGKPE